MRVGQLSLACVQKERENCHMLNADIGARSICLATYVYRLNRYKARYSKYASLYATNLLPNIIESKMRRSIDRLTLGCYP